jgi:hypothetical protein
VRLFTAARASFPKCRNADFLTRGFVLKICLGFTTFFTTQASAFDTRLKKKLSAILLKRRSRCVNRTCASKDDDNSSSIHSSALAVLFELVSEASFPGKRIFDGSIFGFRFAYGVG